MKRLDYKTLLLSTVLTIACSTQAFAAGTPCDKLSALTIPDVTVTSAGQVPANGFVSPGQQAPLTLPAFCRVQGVARPTSDSEIRFEVWLPAAAAWNGKFQGVGTGGYDGSIGYNALAEGVRRGYAVTSTDMGHVGGDLDFGQNHPEKVIDWAHRAMHVTTETAKLIVRNSMGRWPDYSYFIGCATGGHQSIAEVQRYPEDYDGVIAGDPANSRLQEIAAYIWFWKALHDEKGAPILNQAKLQTITNAATALCDGDDGVKDGVIDDPRRCKFDPAALLCKGGETDACLTQPQIDGIKKVYAGLRNPRTGEPIFPGFAIGSEGYGAQAGQGWGGFLVNPKIPMRSEAYTYWLFHDPNWDFRTFDFDKDFAYALKQIGDVSSTDPNLSAFKNRGGKLLMYTGWSDAILPGEDVIEYYESIRKAMGAQNTDAFMRFFIVPGMGHCSGGPGPTTFDMLPALEQWVEKGTPPQNIPASRVVDGKAQHTRLLCPYPQVARWTGKGSSDDRANFVCKVER